MAYEDTKSTAADPNNPTADEQLAAGEYNNLVDDLLDHSARHEDGGADELDVTGLAGDLADAQDPKQEAVEDFVDALLAAGASITLTYDDAAGTLTVAVDETSLDHDALTGFVASEHVDHSGVSVTAGDGLAGGGDLTATRTLDVRLDIEDGGSDVAGAYGLNFGTNLSVTDDGDDTVTVTASGGGGSEWTRVDVTTTSATLSAWDSAWVDTAAAGGAVTVTLPADADVADGDRVEVGVEDATNDTTVSSNTGQSILGSNPTLTQIGDTVTMEYKSSTSTWMVR